MARTSFLRSDVDSRDAHIAARAEWLLFELRAISEPNGVRHTSTYMCMCTGYPLALSPFALSSVALLCVLISGNEMLHANRSDECHANTHNY